MLTAEGGQRAEEGVSRLRTLANQGDADAACLLATLCASGAWTPRDWNAAFDWLVRAAEGGNASARGQLDLLAPTGGDGRARRADLDFDALTVLPDRQPVCEAPRVRMAEGFASPAVCDWLIGLGRGRVKPAKMVAGYGAEPSYTSNRTNSDFAFGVLDADCILALVRERIAAMVKLPVAAMEPPQILHYAVGQELKPHVDYLQRPDRDAGGYQGDRICTFLLYLNDGFGAGATWFPRAAGGEIKVKPPTGGALYFANVDPAGRPDPMTLHAGLPPTSGEKWLLSQWIHDRPFVAGS